MAIIRKHERTPLYNERVAMKHSSVIEKRQSIIVQFIKQTQ